MKLVIFAINCTPKKKILQNWKPDKNWSMRYQNILASVGLLTCENKLKIAMTGCYVRRGTAASVSNVNKRDNSVFSVALCLKKIAEKRGNIVLQLAAHQVIKTTCLCTSFQMKKGQRYVSSGWSLWRSKGRTSTSLPSILSFVRGISRQIHIPKSIQ